jgi:hypothetical protein
MISSYLFRVPPEKQNIEMIEGFVEDETEDDILDSEAYIRCRQCLNIITYPAERITVQESHRHTFANPHGIVFEIGCFRTAKGCGYVGPSSDEFGWFAGYSWRIAVCFRCLVHLGWLFESPDANSFHGLILDLILTR